MPHIPCSSKCIPNIQYNISSLKGSKNPLEWSCTSLTMHTEAGQTPTPHYPAKRDTNTQPWYSQCNSQAFKVGEKLAIKISDFSTVIKDQISVVIDTNKETFFMAQNTKNQWFFEELSWHQVTMANLPSLHQPGTRPEKFTADKALPCPETCSLTLKLLNSNYTWTNHPLQATHKTYFSVFEMKVTPTIAYGPWRSINHHHIFHIKTLFWTSMGIEQMV